MSKYSIVAVCDNGHIPTDYDIARFAQHLIKNGFSTNKLNIYVFNEVETERFGFASTQEQSNRPLEEKIKHAVIFIGTMYKDQLVGPNKDIYAFAIKLTNDIVTSRAYPSGFNNALLSAIHILNNEQGVIPRALARKYGFNNSVLKIIHNVPRM